VDTDPSKQLDRLELVRDSLDPKLQIEIRAITLEEGRAKKVILF
jgi:hypothetical protein